MALPSRPYPVNLLVAGRSVLVVGGGTVALEKVDGLLDAEAESPSPTTTDRSSTTNQYCRYPDRVTGTTTC